MRLLLLVVLIAALLNCKGNDKPVEQKAEVGPKMPEQGCVAEISSKLVSIREVSPIQNLVEDRVARGYENECTVHFDLVINGKSYHLDETEFGLEQMNSICYYAKERARTNLLQELGGEFKSESVVMCRQVDN